MKTRFFYIAVFFFLNVYSVNRVTAQQVINESSDKIELREFKRLDIFPAISYSPETSLTLGVIGIKYFDFSRGDLSTPISNLEFVAVYTLKNQILIESKWDFFGQQSRWRTRGEAFFNRYPDRNYGLGNDASALLAITDEEGQTDTLNYLEFNSDRIKFSPVVLRKVGRNYFLGLQYDMEYLYLMKITVDNYAYLNADSSSIQNMPIEGVRSGIGFQILFDNRDFILNPIKGSLISLNNLNYGRVIGSDYQFSTIYVDARHYINTFKNQTLALRGFTSFRWTNNEIPMRALSRVGGERFIRGYFLGTFQDNHMAAFEMEYRLPFWSENTTAPLWQVWKRLGVVAFISGAQVIHKTSDFQMDNFNLAVGGGLRILFNTESRVNLRIDYAFGLNAHSNGPGKRQSGLYFNLGEAF